MREKIKSLENNFTTVNEIIESMDSLAASFDKDDDDMLDFFLKYEELSWKLSNQVKLARREFRSLCKDI